MNFNHFNHYHLSRFVTHNDKTAVIIRKKLEHSGHDIQDMTERHACRPDPALVAHIESLIDQVKRIKKPYYML